MRNFLFDPAYFPLPDAAHYSGLGSFTLRRLIKSSELPHIRIAGRILIERAALDDFLQRHVRLGCPEGFGRLEPQALESVRGFVAERCLPKPEHRTAAADLHVAYREWCTNWGVPEVERLNPQKFGQGLAALGFIRARGTAGRRLWSGVVLRAAIVEGS